MLVATARADDAEDAASGGLAEVMDGLGSASMDLLRQSSESLAGRIRYLELTPVHGGEIGAERHTELWLRGGFPDIQWTLEELIVEGEKIAARYTMRGTHEGTFFGVPATGKSIAVQAMTFYVVVDGKIVFERSLPDLLGLMQQIGAVPAPS